VEEKICHEAIPTPTLVSGVRAESAPASAVFTDFVWDHVFHRGSCTSATVLPAFDVRAEPRASSKRSEVVGAGVTVLLLKDSLRVCRPRAKVVLSTGNNRQKSYSEDPCYWDFSD
jgi:hypothetical protein